MKLKPIPQNTVVHTPTEEVAKELLAILHENGYKWPNNSKYSLLDRHYWNNNDICYIIKPQTHIVGWNTRFSLAVHSLEKLTFITLAEFKERYCEKEKPQPKFKVGDIMRVTDAEHPLYNKQVKLDTWIDGGNYWLTINMSCGLNEFRESDLEPYAEPETKPTEEMEENKEINKELNLCELLKGHEGEMFYSPIFGERKFVGIEEGMDYPISFGEAEYYDFGIDGCWSDGGLPVLYPSRALYEQYPLDPYTAWMKWKEEWTIYHIRISFQPYDGSTGKKCSNTGTLHFNDLGFRTPADRDKCIEEIKAIIEKYSKK